MSSRKTHSTTIDRAAIALLRSRWPDEDWDFLGEESRDKLRKHVRAVIEAIREPSEEQIEAASEVVLSPRQSWDTTAAAWYAAMIDALLADGE